MLRKFSFEPTKKNIAETDQGKEFPSSKTKTNGRENELYRKRKT